MSEDGELAIRAVAGADHRMVDVLVEAFVRTSPALLPAHCLRRQPPS